MKCIINVSGVPEMLSLKRILVATDFSFGTLWV